MLDGLLRAWALPEHRFRVPLQLGRVDFLSSRRLLRGTFLRDLHCGQQLAGSGRAGVVRAGEAHLGHRMGQARHVEAGAGAVRTATIPLAASICDCSEDNSSVCVVLYYVLYAREPQRSMCETEDNTCDQKITKDI